MAVTISPALSALRLATAELHSELERTLVLSRPDAGVAEYRDYATAMYGWMAPLEERLWSAHCPEQVGPAQRRGKPAWLREDLLALGVRLEDIEALPRCEALPRVSTAAQCFGVAYVVEGSQLGGQLLLRRLAPALAPHTPRYLVGYGSETGARWKSLLSVMSERVAEPQEIEVAATSARDTFASLRAWFIARGVA